MGRPLNKKYFGNRNIGSTSTATDDGIGGQGVASINWSTLGSFSGNGTFDIDGLNLPAPTLPNGVQATWALVFEVAGVTTGAGKTDLAVGDTFGSASFPGMVAAVTSISGTNAVFSVLPADGGSRGNELGYNEMLKDTTGVTLTKIAGTGTAATFLVDVTYRVKSGVINEKGSGYTGAETFTATIINGGSGTAPAGTLVLTTDSGAPSTLTNQENAIVMYANVGNGAGPVDIIRQVSTRRYKVTDGTTVGIVELGTDPTPETGEAYIVATATGGTYYVTKLTAHKATLVTKTGDGALNGLAAPWSFAAGTATVVQIENA